jgi:anti-sigma factor RsiW
MITCEVFHRHVDTVVDGEVDPNTQIDFEQHLSECGPCRVHLAFARSFKRQLRDAMLESSPAAKAELAERIKKALDVEDVRRAAAVGGIPIGATPSRRPPLGLSGVRLVPVKARYAVPAAAAVVALAVLAAHEGGNPEVDLDAAGIDPTSGLSGVSYLDDVVERHSREHPAEVSGPPMQVASWFQDKLEFSVRPIEFSRSDVRLVGARLSSVRDRDAAAFYYDVHGRRVTVVVFEPPRSLQHPVQPTRVAGRSFYIGHARGRTIPVVEYHGLSYAIAGDLDSGALVQLAASAHIDDR